VRDALASGTPHIIPLEQIAEGTTLATISAVGTANSTSGAALRHVHFDRALALFEPFANRHVGGFIASEVGPRAVTYGLRESAATGIPVVDAPCNGRAHPLFVMGSLGLHRLPRQPTATVAVGGQPGSASYVELAVRANVGTAARIVRDRAARTGIALAVVRNPVSAAFVRDHAAVGSLAYAHRIGHELLAQLPVGSTAVLTELARLMGGRVLASGHIASVKLAERQGFTVGRIVIKCVDGSLLDILVCNEFMAALAEGQPIMAFPDLIALFDRRTGLPLASTEAHTDQSVAVFAVPRDRLILGSTMRDLALLRGIEDLLEVRFAA
jgi:DUF917 family protein